MFYTLIIAPHCVIYDSKVEPRYITTAYNEIPLIVIECTHLVPKMLFHYHLHVGNKNVSLTSTLKSVIAGFSCILLKSFISAWKDFLKQSIIHK